MSSVNELFDIKNLRYMAGVYIIFTCVRFGGGINVLSIEIVNKKSSI